ncbi:MAG: hypothetical protein WCY09_09660 [Candidatus Omnitrophota bacterium]
MKSNETMLYREHTITCKLDEEDNKYYLTDLDEEHHKSLRQAKGRIDTELMLAEHNAILTYWQNLDHPSKTRIANYYALMDVLKTVGTTDDFDPDEVVAHVAGMAKDLVDYCNAINSLLFSGGLPNIKRLAQLKRLGIAQVGWLNRDGDHEYEVFTIADGDSETLANDLKKNYHPFDAVVVNGDIAWSYDLSDLSYEQYVVQVETKISVAKI